MPINIHNSYLVHHFVPLQRLQRDNGGTLSDIVVDRAMEYLHASIIRSICKQWEGAGELHGANCFFVEPHSAVRSIGEFKIMPEETAVVRSHNKMVAAVHLLVLLCMCSRSDGVSWNLRRMNIKGADQPCSRLKCLDQLALPQVVCANSLLRRQEKNRLGGMEVCGLRYVRSFSKRRLAQMARQGVNDHGSAMS